MAAPLHSRSPMRIGWMFVLATACAARYKTEIVGERPALVQPRGAGVVAAPDGMALPAGT